LVKREKVRLGVLVSTCNPSTWKAEAGVSQVQFEASLDYIAKSCLGEGREKGEGEGEKII
jgi:hypothetical protein